MKFQSKLSGDKIEVLLLNDNGLFLEGSTPKFLDIVQGMTDTDIEGAAKQALAEYDAQASTRAAEAATKLAIAQKVASLTLGTVKDVPTK